MLSAQLKRSQPEGDVTKRKLWYISLSSHAATLDFLTNRQWKSMIQMFPFLCECNVCYVTWWYVFELKHSMYFQLKLQTVHTLAHTIRGIHQLFRILLFARASNYDFVWASRCFYANQDSVNKIITWYPIKLHQTNSIKNIQFVRAIEINIWLLRVWFSQWCVTALFSSVRFKGIYVKFLLPIDGV